MRSKPYLLLLLAAFVCSSALADSDDVPADVATKLRAALKERSQVALRQDYQPALLNAASE